MKKKFECGHTGKGKYCHRCANDKEAAHKLICAAYENLVWDVASPVGGVSVTPHVDQFHLINNGKAIAIGLSVPFNSDRVYELLQKVCKQWKRTPDELNHIYEHSVHLRTAIGGETWVRVYCNGGLYRSLVELSLKGYH